MSNINLEAELEVQINNLMMVFDDADIILKNKTLKNLKFDFALTENVL